MILLVYSGKLILSDFQLDDPNFGLDRQYERVQPKLPVFVTVIDDQLKIKANLIDLSLSGMLPINQPNGHQGSRSTGGFGIPRISEITPA